MVKCILTDRKDYLPPKNKEAIMINTINLLDMFLRPRFVLIEIIAPQRYDKLPTDARLRPMLFLLQLFKTKRT